MRNFHLLFRRPKIIDSNLTLIQKKRENGRVAAIKMTDIIVRRSAHKEGSSKSTEKRTKKSNWNYIKAFLILN